MDRNDDIETHSRFFYRLIEPQRQSLHATIFFTYFFSYTEGFGG